MRTKTLGRLEPAVFLDRDGTMIEDPGYLRAVSQVRLLPGVAEAIRSLRHAGYRIVVATNQSGIARGYFNEIDLAAVHDRLRELLAGQGAQLDGIYYCPYHPEGVVPAYRKESDWRKPACGMLTAAAQDLGLDLPASWMVGDSPRDVEAGRRAGCRTALVAGSAADGPTATPAADVVAGSLLEASRCIVGLPGRAAVRPVQVEADGH